MNILNWTNCMFMFRTSVPTERRKDPTTSYPASIVTILTQPASKPTSLTGVSFFLWICRFCSRILSGQIYFRNYIFKFHDFFLGIQGLPVRCLVFSIRWQCGTFSDSMIGNDGPIEIYIFSIFDKKELKILFWRPWSASAIW